MVREWFLLDAPRPALSLASWGVVLLVGLLVLRALRARNRRPCRPAQEGGKPDHPGGGAETDALFPVPVPHAFEDPSVHRLMVYDHRRTAAFRQAIARTVKEGDVVVDVGTGTGLLAFLCARAGARRVHAIDSSAVVLGWARRLAEANGLADRIVFHHGHSREVDLGERADVVVSEVIGYLGFEEGIVATLADARERFLKPGGRLIPQAVALHAAPVHGQHIDPSLEEDWGPVHGIDFSPMRRLAPCFLFYTVLATADLLAAPQPVLAADFRQGTGSETHAIRRFRVTRTGLMSGVGLWFRAALADGVLLGSGPGDGASSWLQGFVPLPRALAVSPGEQVEVAVALRVGEAVGRSCELGVRVTQVR